MVELLLLKVFKEGINIESEKCPCCPNHCPVDNLKCGRGQEYFADDKTDEPQTIDGRVIADLKRCGHLLHHNKNLDTDKILSKFSEEELNRLHELLEKFLRQR